MEPSSNPIVSLFNYEFAKYKPAAPPSPVIQPKPGGGKSSKKKRDRKAEYEKAKARKAAMSGVASGEMVDSGEQCAWIIFGFLAWH